MTPDERTTDEIVTELLAEKIRQLEAEIATERRLKSEILARYETVCREKQRLAEELQTFRAELAKERARKPVIAWATPVQIGHPPREDESFCGEPDLSRLTEVP